MSREFKKVFKINDMSNVEIGKSFVSLEQFYLNFYPRIRCRNFQGNCTMTVKISLGSGEKIEHAHTISKEEYNKLKSIRVSKLITKHRHQANFDGNIGIYDKYYGDLSASILSMEFESKDELNNFKTPVYLIDTGDIFSVEDLKV